MTLTMLYKSLTTFTGACNTRQVERCQVLRRVSELGLTSVVVLVAELIGILDKRGVVEGNLAHALYQMELAPGRPCRHYEVVAGREREEQGVRRLHKVSKMSSPVRL